MIIDRYLIREVSAPFVAVTAVLMVIFLTFSLSRFLTDASGGLLTGDEVLRLTLLKGVIALEVLLPIGLYVAVVLGLGRLYRDAEMEALRAGGVGEGRLLRPVLALAFVLAVGVGLLSTLARPWAYAETYALKARAEATSEVERIKPGQFYSYQDRQRTVFIERMAERGQRLENIFIRSRDGADLEILSSKRGRFQPLVDADHHRLELFDAKVYKKVADGPDLYGDFGTFAISLSVREPEPVGYRSKAEPTLALRDSADPAAIAEYQWRLSTPVSTLLLAMLAIPLSRSRPRQGQYARLLLAMIVYAMYFNFLGISRTWVEQRTIDHLWAVPLALAVTVTVLFVPWRRLRGRFSRTASEPPDAPDR